MGYRKQYNSFELAALSVCSGSAYATLAKYSEKGMCLWGVRKERVRKEKLNVCTSEQRNVCQDSFFHKESASTLKLFQHRLMESVTAEALCGVARVR